MELKPCGCGNEPVWGRITAFNAAGDFIVHDALRCLHCHYWFYINGEKDKTAERWNARAEAAEIAKMREDLAEAVGALEEVCAEKAGARPRALRTLAKIKGE